MIPNNLKLLGRDIPIIVDSADKQYLEWAEKFLTRLTDSADSLVGAARTYLREQELIRDGDAPELLTILFDGNEDKGWCYSLMFATPEPLGVIFEGHRPVGTVHGALLSP